MSIHVPHKTSFLLGVLVLGLAAGATLDASGGRAVQVVGRDPALVVALVVGTGAGALATGERLLLGGDGADLLGDSRLGTLGLGEESLDVGLVHEVAGTSESAQQEDVQEDAVKYNVSFSFQVNKARKRRCLHLRIKDAGRCLNDANGMIIDTDLEDLVGRVAHNSHELQADILRLHVEDEGVRKGLLLAGGNGRLVGDGSQVANHGARWVGIGTVILGIQELATNEGHQDRLILIVGNVDDSFGGSAID